MKILLKTKEIRKWIKEFGLLFQNKETNLFNATFIIIRNWWILFVIVIVITAWTRYYKVTEPDHVW